VSTETLFSRLPNPNAVKGLSQVEASSSFGPFIITETPPVRAPLSEILPLHVEMARRILGRPALGPVGRARHGPRPTHSLRNQVVDWSLRAYQDFLTALPILTRLFLLSMRTHRVCISNKLEPISNYGARPTNLSLQNS